MVRNTGLSRWGTEVRWKSSGPGEACDLFDLYLHPIEFFSSLLEHDAIGQDYLGGVELLLS